MNKSKHYVYIVKCADSTLYTGYTTDVTRRIKEHNQGQGAKYTRARTPVKLCYTEEYGTRSKAQQREYEIKQLSRSQKIDLIKEGENE